jgi:hypothetical protein
MFVIPVGAVFKSVPDFENAQPITHEVNVELTIAIPLKAATALVAVPAACPPRDSEAQVR